MHEQFRLKVIRNCLQKSSLAAHCAFQETALPSFRSSRRSQAISAKAIIVEIATSAAVARISLVFQTWPVESVTCPLSVDPVKERIAQAQEEIHDDRLRPLLGTR
jgi:hypothetical protein